MGGWLRDGIISHASCTAAWPTDSKGTWNFCCAGYREALFPTQNTKERIPFQSQNTLYMSSQEESLPRDSRGA